MLTTPSISLEFFPPAPGVAEERFWRAFDRLWGLEPSFVSITYGAGGSSRDRSDTILQRIVQRGGPPPAAHLTCVGQSRDAVDATARRWAAFGIRRIVALRGDMPDQAPFQPHPQGYASAAELVAGLKRVSDFSIAVGAYPEVHPEAASSEADLDNLKRKFDAGADFAISQYFFDPEIFLRFRDRALKAGISQPILPGIMPIANFQGVVTFSKRCGASVPNWLAQQFEGLENDPELQALIAASATVDLCQQLAEAGVGHFHFYTMNQAQQTLAACRRLGIRPNQRKAA